MDNLNADMVARLRIPLPPVADQLEIVEFIERRSDTIDALIAKANGMIDTMREYRSALISDAVTGKIDVRGAA
jgi:type I restriction enzyme S subunit